MMEEIKPKKERKFLKAVGNIAKVLVNELVMGIARKFIGKAIDKVGNKRQGLSIVLIILASTFAVAQFPNTTNKQRLGFQTTADGLVWRGSISDTASIQPINNQNAWVILDTINLKFYTFDFTSNVWNLVGGALTMPFDSITFNTAKNGTVGVGEVEYNDTQGSLIQGLKGGNVINVIGQQLHQRVNNRTGAPLAKGDVVYLAGSQGNRITVAKALAISDAFSANTFGVVAESIADNQSGFIITEGLITGLNTSALTEDSAVYLSPTVAGALTSTKPQAPQHSVYIGVCVKSNNGSGELFVKIRNGLEMDELHDTRIINPVTGATLYYSDGLWRDTTAALLVSDTASMLANYSLKSYVDSIAQNFQDSIDEITNGYFKQEFPTVTKDTLNWTKPVQLPVGGSNLLLVYRNGQMINDAQYSVIDTNKVKINSGSYKLGENYTIVYVKGGGGSGGGGTTFDTSILNLQSRLDLKLNLSDTASMLSNYATKAYADTTGRFYARQDFSNVSSSTLTWTQSDTLVTGNEEILQVYRNGQILLPSQYTVVSSTSITIAATSYKAGENYTVIFPRGGGAASGGGSGSLTSISAGTGILVSPDPITTTGVVSADLSVLMELTDTSLLNLTSRFASKLNTTDTASLSNRIDAKGNGTVTSVATGYGLSGGTITTTGTLRLDSASVYNYIRDSIVDVQIGNDTIKILKQEYNNVTSDTLTWTITSKFPIQLRAYILLFRNGQLLINDQYSIIDTNKIKVAATSYKLGENYTVVTVSGIGSAGISQTGNPIYPEAGIALSTGTTWTTSIPNNSTNWNTAYTDRLKWDGGSTGLTPSTGRTSLGGTTIGQSMFTLTNPSVITFPRFNADNTVTALSAASFRSAIGAGTVTSVNVAAGTPMSITNNTTTPEISMAAATGSVNGYLASTDWTTFNNKQNALSNASASVSGILTSTDWTTFNNKENTITAGTTGQYFRGDKTFQTLDKSAVGLGNVDNTSDANKPVSTATQTALNLKFNTADTTQLNLTSRFAGKLNYTDTSFLFTQSDTSQLNLTSRFAAKQNTLSGTGFVKASGTSISYDNSSYLRTGLADSTYLKLTGGTLTGGLTGTTGTFTGLNVNNSSESILGLQPGDNNYASRIQFKHFGTIRQEIIKPNSTANLQFRSYPTGTATGGYEFYVSNGSLESLAATIGTDKSLAVTGNITEAGNNVLTNLDTISLSNRINAKGNGTVTNVSGSGAISVATGTTTPLISVADAAFGTAGIVTATGTQQFSGDKIFEGITQFNARAVFKDYTYVATRLAGLSSTDRFATVTIGSGLSLSTSGTLSATGGIGTVTNVTGTLPISVANGTTTPSITIADAGTGASGVVNTTIQSFAGNKTFTGNVVMQNDIDNREGYIRRKYVAGSAATYTVLDNDTWIRWGRSDLVTFTLPNASDFPGREIYILNIGNGSITSNATNIQQLDGSQNSQITGAGPGKWCTLVSTGSTYWQKMAGN